MQKNNKTKRELLREVKNLRDQLSQVDETLRAIKRNGTDAHRKEEESRIIGTNVIAEETAGNREEAEIARKDRERFELLSETATLLLSKGSPHEVINELCKKVMARLDCQVFFNYLVDEEKQRLHLNACAGITKEAEKDIEWLDYGVAVCGCAARDRCRIVAENISTTQDPRTNIIRAFGIEAYSCHPLIASGRLIGTLSFGTRTRSVFKEEELSIMKAVADQVAIAMEKMRLLQNLRIAADYMNMVFNAMMEPMLIIDSNGNLNRMNRAARAIYGLDPADVARKIPLKDFIRRIHLRRPDGKPLSMDELPAFRAFREGKIIRERMMLTNAKGDEIHVLSNASPIFSGGEVTGAVAVWTDITEQERLLEETDKSREELESRVKQRTVELAKADELLAKLFSSIGVARLNSSPSHYRM